MFSVIIPLYNHASHIERAICSVLNQICQDFELVVVNDGSTDNCLEIVRKINQLSNIPINILDQFNAGVSIARNNGVRLAQNEYIAFLDADDWWESNYLLEMKNLIATYPQAGIYGSGYFIVKQGRKVRATIGVDDSFKNGIVNYCRVYSKTLTMPLWTGATIIKKSVFESLKGFNPKLKLGEDFDLWIRVTLNHSVAFLNKNLANYNQDVDTQERAVGTKFYSPEEHMIFTDYGELHKEAEFQLLYEKLALYLLLRYYSAGKNLSEIGKIMSCIDWNNHPFKYRLYYRILPRKILHLWLASLNLGSRLKYIVKEYLK